MTQRLVQLEEMRRDLVHKMAEVMIFEPPLVMQQREGRLLPDFLPQAPSAMMLEAQRLLAKLNRAIEAEKAAPLKTALTELGEIVWRTPPAER